MSTPKSIQSCYPITPSITRLDGVDIEEIIVRYATPTPISLPRARPHRSLNSPPTTAGRSTFLSHGSSPTHSSSPSDANNLAHSGSLNRARLFGRSPIPEFVPRCLRRPSTAAGSRELLGSLASIPSSTAPDSLRAQRSASLSRIPVPNGKVPTYIDCVTTRLSRTVPRKSSFFKDDDWASKKANKPIRNAPTILKRQTLNGLRPSHLPTLSAPLQDEWIEAGDAKAIKGNTKLSVGPKVSSNSLADHHADTTKPRNVPSPLVARQDQKLKSCLRKASDSDSSKSSTIKSVTFEDEVLINLGYRKPASSADKFRETMVRVNTPSSVLQSIQEGRKFAKIREGHPRCRDPTKRNLGCRTPSYRKSSGDDSASFFGRNSVKLDYGGSTSLAEKFRKTMDRVKARSSYLQCGKEGPSSGRIQKEYRFPLLDTDSDLPRRSSSIGSSPSSKLATTLPSKRAWANELETRPDVELEPEVSSGDADVSGEGLTSDSSTSEDSSLMSNDPKVATTTTTITPAIKSEKAILKIMTPITIFSQAPQAPLEVPTTAPEARDTVLTIMAPTTTHYQAPTTTAESMKSLHPHSSSLHLLVGTTCQLHMAFSPASGVIYGCVAFVILCLALMHLIENLNGIELGNGLTAKFVVGLVVTVMVGHLNFNRLATTTKEVVQAWSAALRTIYQAMIDWIGRYEVH
ncbi:hypothetical protein J1614_003727 [Plenodomus biglobosus]|nr:hypothetical protein J1614_003727 [Plenodomus biglobosus]